ncbi:hypothetical protein [Streptomyces sp. NPDC048845]|uniref:hypothetical protein n=1 Tax=Streptomyces sp. NPDC048845 TaxID=3155390 RepID=UPI003421CE41
MRRNRDESTPDEESTRNEREGTPARERGPNWAAFSFLINLWREVRDWLINLWRDVRDWFDGNDDSGI